MTHKVETHGTKLYFTGDIDCYSVHDFIVNLHQLEDTLSKADNKSITIYLSSGGGSCYSGLRMYDAICNSILDITIVTQGFIASSATILLIRLYLINTLLT